MLTFWLGGRLIEVREGPRGLQAPEPLSNQDLQVLASPPGQASNRLPDTETPG
jgi:hypothetical protein